MSGLFNFMMIRFISFLFCCLFFSCAFAAQIPDALKSLIVPGAHHIEYGPVDSGANVLTYDLADYTGPPAPYAGMTVYIFIGMPSAENKQYQSLLEREIALRQKKPPHRDVFYSRKISIKAFKKPGYTGTLIQSERYVKNSRVTLSNKIPPWIWQATWRGYYLKSKNIFIYVFVSEVEKKTQVDPEKVIDLIIGNIKTIKLDNYVSNNISVLELHNNHSIIEKNIMLFYV